MPTTTCNDGRVRDNTTGGVTSSRSISVFNIFCSRALSYAPARERGAMMAKKINAPPHIPGGKVLGEQHINHSL